MIGLAVKRRILVEAGAGGNIDFAADDRMDARSLSRLPEQHSAVEHAVIGDRNGGLPELLDALHKLLDAAGAVEQRIFCMHMQMHKRLHTVTSFLKCGILNAECGICDSESSP